MRFANLAFGSLFLTFCLCVPPITTVAYISRHILKQANFVKNRSWVFVRGWSEPGTSLRSKLFYCESTELVCLWMLCRSVGVGTPPRGPGGEAEEFASGGSAYGAHTIPHRQREGEVFNVYNHFFSFSKAHKFQKNHITVILSKTVISYRVYAMTALLNKRG